MTNACEGAHFGNPVFDSWSAHAFSFDPCSMDGAESRNAIPVFDELPACWKEHQPAS
jgi:hypothetical protein